MNNFQNLAFSPFFYPIPNPYFLQSQFFLRDQMLSFLMAQNYNANSLLEASLFNNNTTEIFAEKAVLTQSNQVPPQPIPAVKSSEFPQSAFEDGNFNGFSVIY